MTDLARLQQLVRAIELAQELEVSASRDMSARLLDKASLNLPWMPFPLFDFAALLFEALPLIPDGGRFLDVGAGPGSKMVIARDVFGLDVHGIEILDVLAAMARAAGLPVQTADADNWAGYEEFGGIWVNRPFRDAAAERFLEDRIWHETKPGTVVIIANTETRPPQDWIIVTDMWADLRRGAWVKPFPIPDLPAVPVTGRRGTRRGRRGVAWPLPDRGRTAGMMGAGHGRSRMVPRPLPGRSGLGSRTVRARRSRQLYSREACRDTAADRL